MPEDHSHLHDRLLAEADLAAAQHHPATIEQTDHHTHVLPDKPWNVIVWNDPVNLMSYVTYVFQKLFGYPIEKATKLMLEVHHEGKSVVASAGREKAEYYVSRLHAYGLQATLQKPDG